MRSGVSGTHIGDEFRQSSGFNRNPNVFHKFLIIKKIMQRCKARAQYLATLFEMPQVGEAVVLTGVAVAVRVRRGRVISVSGMTKLDRAA